MHFHTGAVDTATFYGTVALTRICGRILVDICMGVRKRRQELTRKNYKIQDVGEKSPLGAQYLHIEKYDKFVN